MSSIITTAQQLDSLPLVTRKFNCNIHINISYHTSTHFQHTNVFTSKQHSCVQGPLRECRSIRSGASGLPYYCTPLVCISVVIGWLTVWRHNKPKTKNTSGLNCHNTLYTAHIYTPPIAYIVNFAKHHSQCGKTHTLCTDSV